VKNGKIMENALENKGLNFSWGRKIGEKLKNGKHGNIKNIQWLAYFGAHFGQNRDGWILISDIWGNRDSIFPYE
jgi:hypothetical protein